METPPVTGQPPSGTLKLRSAGASTPLYWPTRKQAGLGAQAPSVGATAVYTSVNQFPISGILEGFDRYV